MTRRYGHAISVTVAGSHLTGFQWNDIPYRIVEVLAAWHLRDRWWEASEADGSEADGSMVDAAVSTHIQPTASNRYYYRVRCASGLICDVYHDVTSDAWVLDCVYD
ncbi:MAG: DUF6504 family protein [Ktedonobacterales bacterium]